MSKHFCQRAPPRAKEQASIVMVLVRAFGVFDVAAGRVKDDRIAGFDYFRDAEQALVDLGHLCLQLSNLAIVTLLVIR